jgi:hypothetical protein
MRTFGSLLEKLGGKDPKAGLMKGEDGWWTAGGYPVDSFGRPDWCSKCSKIQAQAERINPNDRPSRVVHERAKDGRDVALPLCVEHLEAERRWRDALREKKAGKA